MQPISSTYHAQLAMSRARVESNLSACDVCVDVGFMNGLVQSWIFVPVVSAGSVGPMLHLNQSQNEACDNVLLEWTAGLELHNRGLTKAIMPIILGSEVGEAFDFGMPRKLSEDEHAVTNDACKRHLNRMVPTPDGRPPLSGVERSVAGVMGVDSAVASVGGVVSTVMRYQGTVLNDRKDPSAIIERLVKKCEGILQGTAGTTSSESTE